jgi:hypothetical protein
MNLNSTADLRRYAESAKAKLWQRKIELEQELGETNTQLVAIGRLLKEPSAAKLAALEKARAGIGKKTEPEAGT